MSRVDFKKLQCHISLSLIYANVTCRIRKRPYLMSLNVLPPMLHVIKPYDFNPLCDATVFDGLKSVGFIQ